MLLPEYRDLIDSDEQHAILARELPHALKLTVGFRTLIVNCNRLVTSV